MSSFTLPSHHLHSLIVPSMHLPLFITSWSLELCDSSDFFLSFLRLSSSCFRCGMVPSLRDGQGTREARQRFHKLPFLWLLEYTHSNFQTTNREDKHADLFLLNGTFMSLLWKVTPKFSSMLKNQTLQKWFAAFVNWRHCFSCFCALCFFALLFPLPSTLTTEMGLLNNYLSRGNLLSKYFWSVINFYKQWEEQSYSFSSRDVPGTIRGSQIPWNACVPGAYVNKISPNLRTTVRLNCWIPLD